MNAKRRDLFTAAGFPLLAASGLWAQDCVPHWTGDFAANAFEPHSSYIRAIATFDDGTGRGPALCVGGDFSSVDDLAIPNVVRWDGTRWSSLASGTNGRVRALLVHDDGSGPALYAGGEFDQAGGMDAGGVARWDGSRWSPLGAGLDGAVHALAVFDDGTGPVLYAAGLFSPGNVARWDGSSWTPLGSGTDDVVNALAVFDDGRGPALHAGGAFATAGDVGASRVARWDGATWSALGAGTDGTVNALAVFDDGSGPALYAGGGFTKAGEVGASKIARWDGLAWSSPSADFGGVVHVLLAHDDGAGPALYAGGRGIETGPLVRWDGRSWSAVRRHAAIDQIYALAACQEPLFDREVLVIGGRVTSPDQGGALATWDGEHWSSFHGGVPSGWVRSLLAVGGDLDGSPALYVGGTFEDAGGLRLNSIARWDGRYWSDVGGGVDGTVEAMALYDDGSGPALYALGEFETAGGVATGGVARWDGRTWSSVGGQVSTVEAYYFDMAVFDYGKGPVLYVASTSPFSPPGLGPATIARWDGSSWSVPGEPPPHGVRALCAFDDGSGPALYAAGNFAVAGGVHASGIARWNGDEWSAVGSGIGLYDDPYYDAVWDLAVFDDGRGPALYAAGSFRFAGDRVVNSIARWDGRTWSAVGGGILSGTVTSLAVLDPIDAPAVLFAGGYFSHIGGERARNVARWSGGRWSALGEGTSGTYNFLTDLAAFDDGSGNGPALVAGGNFETAGSIASPGIARWVDCPDAGPPSFSPCALEIAAIVPAPGGWSIQGRALNDKGRFVGSYGSNGPHSHAWAWRWTPEDGLVELPFAPGTASVAADIDDDGRIVGWYRPAGGHDTAFLYDGSKVIDLPSPAPGEWSRARAISDAGDIVGSWSDVNGTFAVLWRDGRAIDVHADLRQPHSEALDVNDAGQVTGWMNYDSPIAFVWQEGQVVELPVPGGTTSRGRAINNRGQVLVWGLIPRPDGSTSWRSFVWDRGRWTDVGVLPGAEHCHGYDINDAGVVVGESGGQAFVWRDGVIADLNTLIPWTLGDTLDSATAINNAGQILTESGPLRLLSPVAPVFGDIDGDCAVDDIDLVILLLQWGEGPSPADLDGDGHVGVPDLLLLLARWG